MTPSVMLQILLLFYSAYVNAQLNSSFPHSYPGIPNVEYVYNSSNFQQWQKYYQVNTASLPNATQCTMPSSYAGNIPVNRSGHPNNTLFFWGLESSPGSLTTGTNSSNEPWAVWLNGGPGSSSLIGLFFEHGPCLIADDLSLVPNQFSIHNLMDTFYVDQPVGTGFSTVDEDGYIVDEDQMGRDFMGFLANLAEVFPSLKTRPLYLIGESYAGVYIPYITKAYFGMTNPPVSLKHFAIGDGSIASEELATHATMVGILETWPQIINFDLDVYKYFREQTHLCGYDINLTFPQTELLPTLRPAFIGEDENDVFVTRFSRPRNMDLLRNVLKTQSALSLDTLSKRGLQDARNREFKEVVNSLKASASSPSSVVNVRRDLSGRPNGVLDPFYQCELLFEVIDYAVNFTAPWNGSMSEDGFDVYEIPDALFPEAPQDASKFLGDMRTVGAIHAPQSKSWEFSIDYPFGNQEDLVNATTNDFGDPSSPPVLFFSELAANSSKSGISWTFLSGQDDFLIASMGTIATIQNMSFGGIQGFTKPPQTAWYGKDGSVAGIVHQERNVSFLLFQNAGHLLSQWQPEHYQTAIREFVLGNNLNGSIDASGSLIGDQFPLNHGFNIPAETQAIFTGSGTTQGSTVWPSATIASWDSAIATFIATASGSEGSLPTGANLSNASIMFRPFSVLVNSFLAYGSP